MTARLSPREMIDRLVAFDTTSRNSNLALIDWVADYLDGYGIRSTLVRDETGTKANLLATIGDPDQDGGIVLSGHTDVVPVDGQPWTTDPFQVVERDGALVGRGTADMKSFSAIGLAMVPEFLARRPTRPIHFALSYDEEVGCLGVDGIVRHYAEHGPKPSVVIVGEPTMMQVIDAHKGGLVVETEIQGLAGHSSMPDRGVNAVMVAGELVHWLNREGEAMRRGPQNPRFDPPYSTLSVNRIEGGTANNIIAAECRLAWEMRVLPGTDDLDVLARYRRFAEGLEPAMRKVCPQCGIRIRQLARIKGLKPQPGSPAETLAKALAGTNATAAVSYGTEAGFFQELGIPTVICGPGSIEDAHRPDESIALDQVEACVQFMARLADRVAA